MSNGEVDKVDEESVRTMKLNSDKRHWSMMSPYPASLQHCYWSLVS